MAADKAEVVLRPKRQITLPGDICAKLGIEPGDTLELTVEKSVLKAVPRKHRALDALMEINETFSRYGVSEAELQKEGRKVRREIRRERRS
ncbi:MAG: AbrB/MazE/SpoVT family DNA-binding domain-containing protein [Actinobacteria bacterium]|nr:AbrB/MazE/SpoVT family DNA-binding domain-containing protein [Actinomycetota bacterium]